MIFTLNIVCSRGSNYAVNLPEINFGFDGIQIIREQVGFELPIDRIHSSISAIKKDYSIVLDESQSLQLKDWFKEKNEYTVSCEDSELNPFFYKKAFCNQSKETGEIEKSWIIYTPVDSDIFEYVYRKYYLKENVDAKMMAG